MPIQSAVAAVLFPMLLPVWQERPVKFADLYPMPFPVRLAARDMQSQETVFANASPGLRCRIAVALGETGRPEVIPVLLGWLEHEKTPDVLATLLRQLRRFDLGKNPSIARVRPFLVHDSPEVRLEAVQLYGRLAGCDPLELGKAAGEEPDRTVRRAVWEALVVHADGMGIEFFRRFWRDPDPGVRAAAAAAAARKPQLAGCSEEFLQLCRDPDPRVRCRIAENIARCPRSMRMPLCRRLLRDPHPSVRCTAARTAIQLGGPGFLELLLPLCADADPAVRLTAVHGLAGLIAGKAVQPVAQRLADTSSLVRAEAVSTLGALHAAGLVVAPAVAPQVEAPAACARAAAYRALAAVGAQSAVAAIAAALTRDVGHPVALAGAIAALGQLRAKPHALGIAKFAGHADTEVRIETAAALGRLDVKTTYPALAKLAIDRDPAVRKQAFHAIARTGSAAFAPTCVAVLKRVSEEDYIHPEDRALACWCAARLRPASPDLVRRLVVQATVAVIPMPGMKMYESEDVLVCASFALAQLARDDPAVRPQAEKVIHIHSRKFTPEELLAQKGNPLVPSAYLREYARQARAFMEHRKIESLPRPLEKPLLPVEELPERTPAGQ